jgi:hypothetical protein
MLEELLKRFIAELNLMLRIQNQYGSGAIPEQFQKITAQMFGCNRQ